ncbi:RING-type zinc-finger LisH dimerization motif [Trinorchestia longiramus]|nr:RING-type zinc-finger LisH dimerization motif [Trinorchestia longiramus]
MSGVSGREHPEFFFKDRYATDFLRVTQGASELPLRHPGTPKKEGLRLDGLTVSSGSGVSTGSPHADVMMCPGCKDEFDSAMKRPILLPGCGHTICSVCVRERAKFLECPVCRRSYPGASVESLPVNISLEALLEGKKGQLTLERIIKEEHNGSPPSETTCSSHGLRQSFWCRSCEEAVCGECLFDKHPADAHTLAKLHDVAAEVKETALATVKVCHEDATRLFSGFLMEFVALLGNFHKAGRLMQQSRRLVAAAESADDFHAATAVYKVIKRVNGEVVEMQLEMHDPHDQTHDEEQQRDGDEGTEKAPPRPTRGSRQSPSPVRVAQARTGTRESAGVVEETSVYAMHTDGRLAKVQTEAYGLHVYSLSSPSSTAYSVAVRLGLLMEFVQREHIEVFLDFYVDETCLGRVYITLRGDMRRSSQFAHLCIGTLGPSYKGTR